LKEYKQLVSDVVRIGALGLCTALAFALVLAFVRIKNRREIPNFVRMHQQEIEASLRDRILHSRRLMLVVYQPDDEGDVLRTEHTINDPERIRSFAILLRVERKIGESPPISSSFHVYAVEFVVAEQS